MQNTQLIDMAAAFAKETKANKAKALALVEQAYALGKTELVKRPAFAHKRVTEHSQNMNKALREFVGNNSGKQYNGAQLVEMFNCEPSAINNVFRVLAADGKVKKLGFVNIPGRKGRPPVLWEIL